MGGGPGAIESGDVMKVFVRHGLIALGVQGCVFGLLLVLMFCEPSESDALLGDLSAWLFAWVLWFYLPVGLLVPRVTGSTGCSGLIEVFWIGVPVGIVLYSAAYGGAVALVKWILFRGGKRQRESSPR